MHFYFLYLELPYEFFLKLIVTKITNRSDEDIINLLHILVNNIKYKSQLLLEAHLLRR